MGIFGQVWKTPVLWLLFVGLRGRGGVCDSRGQNKGPQDNYRETLVKSQTVGRQVTTSGFLFPSTLEVKEVLRACTCGEGGRAEAET